tara:strand:+ start:343 stop:756 length:414 start_codon:yes stop_codon:yes gene_type:complete
VVGRDYPRGTDNKGAYDLCHRFTSAQHSRRIDRKIYKMRELRGAGRVTVKYVPTDENTADIFTKILSRQPFEKHRRTLLNLAAMDLSHALCPRPTTLTTLTSHATWFCASRRPLLHLTIGQTHGRGPLQTPALVGCE